jgi:predicted peptidase
MKAIFLIIFLSFSTTLKSQKMYFDSIFKVKKRTYTYNKNKKLKLDFYKPKGIKKDYPLILYVHGGGFSGGKRDESYIKDFANFLVQRGYAVASISYRLTMKGKGFGCKISAKEKVSAFYNTSEDIVSSIKYILRKKKRFKIDINKVILVGSSAGAEAILHLVYVDHNISLPKHFRFAGLISMAGAITTIDHINLITAIPTQLFHGTSDKLVPFNIASHHYCSKDDIGYLPLYGSKAIANTLKALTKPYFLYAIDDGDHSWNSRPMYQCRKEILDFLFFDILKQKYRQVEVNR